MFLAFRCGKRQASLFESHLVCPLWVIYTRHEGVIRMSIENDAVSLERIDHGVLPSNDLGRAFRFWSSFMGARLNFHANLNARGLNREVPMIVFFTVANHSGFGLALQDFRLSSKPARRLEGVVWGFEVAVDDLSLAVDEAEKQKLSWERLADYSASSPIKESLFAPNVRWLRSI